LKTTFITEESSTYKIDTYGKAFQIARAHLIDDNVGLLNDVPMVIGNDSSKGIADTFFSTHTGTSATTDFFTSGDNSLLHDVLDFSGLAAAVAAMRTQKDIDGRIVGIQPTVLMVPAALEFTARQLLNSAQLFHDQTTDLQPSGNPVQGIDLQLAIEPRLDANSQNDWYLWSVSLHGAV
jgi:phage major head subunit gpT-like protein